MWEPARKDALDKLADFGAELPYNYTERNECDSN